MKLCNLEFLKHPYLHIRKYFPSPHSLHSSVPLRDVEHGQTKRVSCNVATTFTPLRLAAYRIDGESNGKKYEYVQYPVFLSQSFVVLLCNF